MVTHSWLYADQFRIVAELDVAGEVVSRFIYGSRTNAPDYMVKHGQAYRIVCDHRGSPRLVVNALNGTIAQRLDYDAFGRVLYDSNPGFQPFGFAGGHYDADSGLVRFGARDYDAGVGRWTTKDPILFGGKDANLYAYLFGDPVNFVDPDGLDAVTSDATVRQYFYDLWRQSGYGSGPNERAAWIGKRMNLQDPSTAIYTCLKWPWSAAAAQETWTGDVPLGMIALAHTHPDAKSPKPSVGGTKSYPRDDYASKQINAPVYTISRRGIWKILPSGAITQEAGPEWTKSVNAETCTPCAH